MAQSLSQTELTLIAAAIEAIDAVPRSTKERRITDHTVSAAALSSKGKIYTGINVSHFAAGSCAENIAFANAAADGVASSMAPGIISEESGEAPHLTTVVAVANDNRGVINPCGRCRQLMADYYPDIKVIIKDDRGDLRVAGVKELLPFAYVSSLWKPDGPGKGV